MSDTRETKSITTKNIDAGALAIFSEYAKSIGSTATKLVRIFIENKAVEHKFQSSSYLSDNQMFPRIAILSDFFLNTVPSLGLLVLKQGLDTDSSSPFYAINNAYIKIYEKLSENPSPSSNPKRYNSLLVEFEGLFKEVLGSKVVLESDVESIYSKFRVVWGIVNERKKNIEFDLFFKQSPWSRSLMEKFYDTFVELVLLDIGENNSFALVNLHSIMIKENSLGLYQAYLDVKNTALNTKAKGWVDLCSDVDDSFIKELVVLANDDSYLLPLGLKIRFLTESYISPMGMKTYQAVIQKHKKYDMYRIVKKNNFSVVTNHVTVWGTARDILTYMYDFENY